MAIEIARDILSRIRKNPQNIVIQVRVGSDHDAALAALKAASDDIYDLGRPSEDNPEASEHQWNSIEFMTGPMHTPDGPFLSVDAGYTPHQLLAKIPELVARRLEERGVNDARITSPRTSAIWGPALHDVPRCVTMVAFPPPPAPQWPQRRRSKLPDPWFDVAAEWLAGAPPGGPWADIDTLQFPIDLADARPLLVRSQQRGARVVMIGGDLTARIRGVGARWRVTPDLELAYGGPETTDDELIEGFHTLVGVARRLAAEAVYAFVSIEPIFRGFYNIVHPAERTGLDGPFWEGSQRLVCDETALDAFPYQILGPGHLERLKGRLLAGARELEGGRVEVFIGEPEQWLLAHDAHETLSPWHQLATKRYDRDIQSLARDLLAPVLLSERDARALVRERQGRIAAPRAPLAKDQPGHGSGTEDEQ
ncbi:MAG TPA: hypothetical protein VM784_02300 [Actinomycetota bacterium]|nr:hypothetical protein [Vitreimonas sp.]HVM34154.1 hypothetical protein [Actinomycetota bacterium]